VPSLCHCTRAESTGWVAPSGVKSTRQNPTIEASDAEASSTNFASTGRNVPGCLLTAGRRQIAPFSSSGTQLARAAGANTVPNTTAPRASITRFLLNRFMVPPQGREEPATRRPPHWSRQRSRRETTHEPVTVFGGVLLATDRFAFKTRASLSPLPAGR